MSIDGAVQERIETCEDIRAYAPAELTALLAECGLRARQTWWDYASITEIAGAQFFTAVCERAT